MSTETKRITRLVFRVVGCLVAALCATMVLGRTLGVLFDTVPVRMVTWLVRTCSPETIIDGEIAYDVRLGDSMVFYVALFFVLFWIVSARLTRSDLRERS